MFLVEREENIIALDQKDKKIKLDLSLFLCTNYVTAYDMQRPYFACMQNPESSSSFSDTNNGV